MQGSCQQLKPANVKQVGSSNTHSHLTLDCTSCSCSTVKLQPLAIVTLGANAALEAWLPSKVVYTEHTRDKKGLGTWG